MDEALRQLLTLGRGYFEKKQYAQAEKFLAQLVEQNQSFADVYNMLGIIYHDQGQFARAQRAFEAALRINPAYTDAALNLAVIYNDLGKYREAREVYSGALLRQKEAPGNLDPFVKGKIANMYADIGDVYVSSGMIQEAVDEYRRAVNLCASFVDLHMKLGDALRDLGDHAAAKKEFEELIKNNPTYIPGRVHYGIALYSAGMKSEAIAVWEDVLAKHPGQRSAEMYLALVGELTPEAAQQTGNEGSVG
jgi:tetratricopeptide (TPR) repeat protein